MANLLVNQTSNGSGTPVAYTATKTINAKGIFNGASVAVEVSDDGGTSWSVARNLTFPSMFTLDLDGTFSVRATVTGARAKTNISVTIGGSE